MNYEKIRKVNLCNIILKHLKRTCLRCIYYFNKKKHHRSSNKVNYVEQSHMLKLYTMNNYDHINIFQNKKTNL